MNKIMKARRYMFRASLRDNRIMQDITQHMIEPLECAHSGGSHMRDFELVRKLEVGMPADQVLVALSMAVHGMPKHGAAHWYIRVEYRRCAKNAIPSLKQFEANPNEVRDVMPLVRAYRASPIHKTPYSETK